MKSDSNNVKPKTKLVTIHLYKVTRRKFTEVIEVPENISPGELKLLAEGRFEAVGSERFYQDKQYRKREVFLSDEGLKRGINHPSLIALRDTEGNMVLRAKEMSEPHPSQERLVSARAQEEYTRH
ncbi:TPA: hypothetical protein ACKRQV_000181 [Pseudomonas aeruginosa]|nr:hypothetical protein [Pseudomonas aeruginosa]EIU2862463.1 hypothetical protein [Pseudomonas aeruginosa]